MQTDFRQRFVFDELDVRGCITSLEQTTQSVQATHHYPPSLAKLLNEFTLAAVLLRDSIKIEGSLTIQLRTPGAISLVMADCFTDRRVRAVAEYEANSLSNANPIDLSTLDQGAVLAITITPEEGERYQSIVPIEQASLSACLQDYFSRSEQLPSVFSLHTSGDKAVGIALHALPAEKVSNLEDRQAHFARLHMLLDTLSTEEALSLDAKTVLTRLFHEEHCRLFDPVSVEFGCECSEQKSLDAIVSLGRDQINELIAEQEQTGANSIVVDCHFCFQRYEFSFDKLRHLFQ